MHSREGKRGRLHYLLPLPPSPCFLNGTNFSVGLGRGEGSFILTNSFCSFLASPAPRGSRRNISKKACFWHGREGEEGMTHRKKINNNNLFLLPLLTPSSFFSLLSSKPYVNICMLKGGGEKKSSSFSFPYRGDKMKNRPIRRRRHHHLSFPSLRLSNSSNQVVCNLLLFLLRERRRQIRKLFLLFSSLFAGPLRSRIF